MVLLVSTSVSTYILFMNNPPATYQVNGAAIRATRKRQGLGIRETAEAAGISRSYLQRLETGTREQMRPPTYAALRRTLHAQEEELLVPHEET
ncbi:hypothetical protein Sliba_06030 [Streptomyces nigrescens]|uniref:HTH cro/C1-type domain-containing protein n=2 Tax=Streptomyces nigrescens TaxID=1920 RepID=A0A640TAE8_STRNI|nr:hypothetical protein Sliba_06030 [Streptomyces libani subsp. libani]GGV85984.1 hypothetical protein GCM10010500_03470 [Streptomyces libani subsp. libani]